ncbi:hypothetical protein TSUD_63740 [Trifolium subterraneum]|uniref:TF-B3 domain-containing protein n=1 Tax=Trifolium subterraneum TaxID=3900 RepID=A0A2Z6N6U7_TRISU|nr:hypothetical protein TSUD_63740 [Trifolium subterraneum]
MASSSNRTNNEPHQNNARNNTFESLIDPQQGKILIPIDFYKKWKYELHTHKTASLCRPEQQKIVRLSLSEYESFMYYGQEVAKFFGLNKPTRILLDYQIVENKFGMNFLPDVEDDKTIPEQHVINIGSSDNESDHHTEVLPNELSQQESEMDTEVLMIPDDVVDIIYHGSVDYELEVSVSETNECYTWEVQHMVPEEMGEYLWNTMLTEVYLVESIKEQHKCELEYQQDPFEVRFARGWKECVGINGFKVGDRILFNASNIYENHMFFVRRLED